MRENLLIAEIDAILPQTQCRQCGFSGCEPYATAIVEGRADINQCPPGGEHGIHKLAELLGVSPIPLNPAHGISKPKAAALIDEQICIGCTLCILACPVDAIVGAARQTHTVIAAECTGCELCIAPCPVDCISMVPPVEQVRSAGTESHVVIDDLPMSGDENKKAADRARARHQFRLQRLEREKQEQEERLAQKTGAAKSVNASPTTPANGDRKKAVIQAALERVMAGRSKVTEEK
ncbi:MAG: RnfABCDGE type electron transport complex subunit B [Nitrosospira sp.]